MILALLISSIGFIICFAILTPSHPMTFDKNETGKLAWSSWLPATKQDLINLMAKVTDDLGNIKTEIADLNTLIQTLQNSPGEISAEDQATLDAVTAKMTSLVTAADALTVPAVPPVPPTA